MLFGFLHAHLGKTPGKILGDVDSLWRADHAHADGVVLRVENVGAMAGRVHQGRVGAGGIAGQSHVLATGVKTQSRFT